MTEARNPEGRTYISMQVRKQFFEDATLGQGRLLIDVLGA
jgi:hypothetical protein